MKKKNFTMKNGKVNCGFYTTSCMPNQKKRVRHHHKDEDNNKIVFTIRGEFIVFVLLILFLVPSSIWPLRNFFCICFILASILFSKWEEEDK